MLYQAIEIVAVTFGLVHTGKVAVLVFCTQEFFIDPRKFDGEISDPCSCHLTGIEIQGPAVQRGRCERRASSVRKRKRKEILDFYIIDKLEVTDAAVDDYFAIFLVGVDEVCGLVSFIGEPLSCTGLPMDHQGSIALLWVKRPRRFACRNSVG